MTHFFISRVGNKRNEIDNIMSKIKFDGINNIIEPFCGTSAISFNIWLKYGDKFNYYLNDNSPELIELYNLFKNETIDDINKEIKLITNKINNKDDWANYYKTGANTVYKSLFFHKYSARGRLGFYPLNRTDLKKAQIKLSNHQLKFLEFIKCPYVHITTNDWFILFDEFKNNDNSLFILDPPYINCFNDFYLNKDLNIYQYFYNNKDINFKSHIYFILEDNWIIRLLLNNYKVLDTYEKTYGLSRKKTNHIILYNLWEN